MVFTHKLYLVNLYKLHLVAFIFIRQAGACILKVIHRFIHRQYWLNLILLLLSFCAFLDEFDCFIDGLLFLFLL